MYLDELSLSDTDSPTLRKALKAVRNIALSSEMRNWLVRTIGRAAMSLWRRLRVKGWRGGF